MSGGRGSVCADMPVCAHLLTDQIEADFFFNVLPNTVLTPGLRALALCLAPG